MPAIKESNFECFQNFMEPANANSLKRSWDPEQLEGLINPLRIPSRERIHYHTDIHIVLIDVSLNHFQNTKIWS